MFNYATYNGVPVITYGLIGLTTSILALVTFNPSILELKEDGEQTTVADAIGLDKIQMPTFIGDSATYLPGMNGMPQPFSSDEPEDDSEDDSEEDDDDDDDDDEPISEQSSVTNPLRQDDKPSGGRKTRNKRKKLRKTKRKTKRKK